jgi:hypothetical protein
MVRWIITGMPIVGSALSSGSVLMDSARVGITLEKR